MALHLMMALSLLLGTILETTFVNAQGDLFISTPANVVHCQPFTITFGGTAPFNISLRDSVGDSNFVLDYEGVYGTSMTWTLSLTGSQPQFTITDTKGGTEHSGTFSIQPQSGSPDNCSNEATYWLNSPPVGPLATSTTLQTTVATISSPAGSASSTKNTLGQRPSLATSQSSPVLAGTSSLGDATAVHTIPTTPTASPTPSNLFAPASQGGSAERKNVRAIIGIAVGGSVGLALIVACWFLYRRRRYRAITTPAGEESWQPGPEPDEVEPRRIAEQEYSVKSLPVSPIVEISRNSQTLPYFQVEEQPLDPHPFPALRTSSLHTHEPSLHHAISQSTFYPDQPHTPTTPREQTLSASKRASETRLSRPLSSTLFGSTSLGPLPLTSEERERLSTVQLQTIQSLVDRNTPAATVQAVIKGMLDVGSTRSSVLEP